MSEVQLYSVGLIESASADNLVQAKDLTKGDDVVAAHEVCSHPLDWGKKLQLKRALKDARNITFLTN